MSEKLEFSLRYIYYKVNNPTRSPLHHSDTDEFKIRSRIGRHLCQTLVDSVYLRINILYTSVAIPKQVNTCDNPLHC